MENNILPKSFVAISDFNSYDWPFEKVIDFYSNEYETIYILGCALERNSDGNVKGGIELLSKIKEVSENSNGRVIYIPGSHDAFLYDYGQSVENDSIINMEYYEGAETAREFEELRRNEPQKAAELLTWLGNLPLQGRHEFNGQKYALAYVFFNQRMYEKFPGLSLRGLFSQKGEEDVFNYLVNIIKSKNGDNNYYKSDVPSKDTIVIVGSTPEENKKLRNLENVEGDFVEVHYAADGMTYDHKNKAISAKKESIFKKIAFPRWKKKTVDLDELMAKEAVLKDVIVDTVKNMDDIEQAQHSLYRFCLTGDVSFLPIDEEEKTKAEMITGEDMNAIICMYAADRMINPKKVLFEDLYTDYVNESALDHVIYSLEQRFGTSGAAVNQLAQAFKEKDYNYITASVGSARDVATKLGFNGMKKTMRKRHCRSVKGYVSSKFGSEYSY